MLGIWEHNVAKLFKLLPHVPFGLYFPRPRMLFASEGQQPRVR